MQKFIHDPRVTWRNAHSGEVKKLFGLRPEDKWPDAGLPARDIQGITCWVDPISVNHGSRRKFHRAMAACPDCTAIMSIGRLHQHKCKTHRVQNYLELQSK